MSALTLFDNSQVQENCIHSPPKPIMLRSVPKSASVTRTQALFRHATSRPAVSATRIASLKIIQQTTDFSTTLKNFQNQIELNKLDHKWIEKWARYTSDGSINPHLIPRNDITPDKSKDDEKFYILSMFPYPSGVLHMGHLRVYTINDVLARYHRFQNKNVINPMGWDSFGLPAENAAIERNVNPKVWTNKNIEKMKGQLMRMLTTFDWDRELSTCNKDYYKHTQKIFLWLYEHGLAYKNFKEINWDPVDQTVLANEQVDANGKSWRSGAIVEKKVLNQWFLKITEFASDLNDDLNTLKDWPNKVKLMQKNWIGKSKGANIKFKVEVSDEQLANKLANADQEKSKTLEVFTSRPDTLFSVQFLALSIDHPIARAVAETDLKLDAFIKQQKEKEMKNSFDHGASDQKFKNKAGFKLSNIFVRNPLTKDREIPVYVAPYVLGGYGSGAVMGCPAHDERDWDFWAENAPSEPVIKTIDALSSATKEKLIDPATNTENNKPMVSKSGTLNSNTSPEFQGLSTKEAALKIVQFLEAEQMGQETTNYKLRDWLISRQRYWGCPIPIVYCDDCGMVPVPEEQLPVILPENIQFNGKGNPLDQHHDFKNCKCPNCNKPATRETDTMDTFMDSSWYFFRFLDNLNKSEPFGHEVASKNMPVDLYLGGVEHAILHLLYARFLSKFLHSIGKWDGTAVSGEPFKKLVSQGMVHGKTFIHPKTHKFLKPAEMDFADPNNPKLVETDPVTNEQLVPEITYEKMSKSKFNGVDPVSFIEKYGADSTRAHILFQAPIELVLYWDEDKISGVQRWLKRLISMNGSITEQFVNTAVSFKSGSNNSLEQLLTENEEFLKRHSFNDAEITVFNAVQKYVGEVDRAFSKDLSFNTVISDYMKLTNVINAELASNTVHPALLFNSFYKLLLLVSPVCPAISEELWEATQQKLGFANDKWSSIFAQKWPEKLPIKESNNVEFSVMINGKFKFKHGGVRSLIEQPESQIIEEVLKSAEDKHKKLLTDYKIKKTIIKPKAICFVTEKRL